MYPECILLICFSEWISKLMCFCKILALFNLFFTCHSKRMKLFLNTLNSWVEFAFGLEMYQWASLMTCKLGMKIICRERWDLSSSKLIKFSSQILTSRLADYLGIFQICSKVFDCVPAEKVFRLLKFQ